MVIKYSKIVGTIGHVLVDCSDICRWLDFLVFSNKDKNLLAISNSTFTDHSDLWDVKELVSRVVTNLWQ